MSNPLYFLLLSSLFCLASCSLATPVTTPAAILPRTIAGDPGFEGYTSAFSSWSPIYCYGDSTFQVFGGTVADCCPEVGNCHPATECAGAGRVVMYQGGDASTCLDTDCATGLVYKSLGDSSPTSMYGCFDSFNLYRSTPGQAAATSLGASASATAQPSSTEQKSSPTNSADASKSKGSSNNHLGLIIAAVVIGLLLLAAIGGLIAYILILQRRTAIPKSAPTTELQHIPPGDGDTGGMKAELPTNEGWAVELPPESVPNSRHEQKPWSNLHPPSPAPNYSPAPPYNPGGTAGMAEMPSGQHYPHYPELSG